MQRLKKWVGLECLCCNVKWPTQFFMTWQTTSFSVFKKATLYLGLFGLFSRKNSCFLVSPLPDIFKFSMPGPVAKIIFPFLFYPKAQSYPKTQDSLRTCVSFTTDFVPWYCTLPSRHSAYFCKSLFSHLSEVIFWETVHIMTSPNTLGWTMERILI